MSSSHPSADVEDDYTADVDALTFGEAAAPWDSEVGSSSAHDLYLMQANLPTTMGLGVSSLGTTRADEANSLHHNLLRDYQFQSLPGHGSTATAAPQRPSQASASDLTNLLSKFESSSVGHALSSGAGNLSTLNDFEEFDTRALRLVDDLDLDRGVDDEEEIAAARSAADAWGPVPTGSSSFSSYATTTPSRIPAPNANAAAALPVPQTTPAKGVMSLADLERQLKFGEAANSIQALAAQPPTATPATTQPTTTAPTSTNPALANLPAALHHLVLSGQTAPPQGGSGSPVVGPSTYTGPPLPHFQAGGQAPQGLSVDDHERQHFYIPLPKSHGLGFMTKAEIALVFRIQLSQLQSIGDPLSDDFYHQVIQARKGGKINASGQAILPVFKSGQARNEDGSPKLPEGTLGRISAFSIHKPKKLMAIGDGSSTSTDEPIQDDQPRKSNMFAGRTLNYLIEEGYRCLMDLEDVDAVLASLAAPQRFEDPTRAFDRQRLSAQRADLCVRLLESLDLDEIHLRMNEVASGEHLIFKFFALPKGRLLIYRSLVLLTPPNTYQLVDVLMHDLTQIAMPAIPAPATDEKLIFLISDLIYSMPLFPYGNEIFGYFLLPQHASKMIDLIRSRMLCNFLQVLFKKGHEAVMILQQNPHVQTMPGVPSIHDAVQQWRVIFDGITNLIQGKIAQIFEGLPKDAKPTLPPTASQLAAKQRREKEKEKEEKTKGSEKKAEEEKKSSAASASTDSKDASKDATSNLSTRFGMWELMAAFFSHANPTQRVWLNEELRQVLLKEVEHLYGEYRERKAKQAEKEKEAATAVTEAEKSEAAKPADAATESKEKDAPKEKEKESNRRSPPHGVPPASSLPPPPSPALRFLSGALLGDASPEFQSISRTWHDLHNDYMYYQMKHQQRVQQEQARLAQQQQLRQQRQQQQQRQWQQYQGQQQQQRGGNNSGTGQYYQPNSSPQRVPLQHQHFHSSPQVARTGGGPGGNRVQSKGGNDASAGVSTPAKPGPVWVKAGTSGAAALKTPAKAAPAAPSTTTATSTPASAKK